MGGADSLDSTFPILVVEDNPVTRRLLQKTLKKSGYEVAAVENGSQALEVIGKRFFPIIITDWVMPEMDGLDLCRTIRKMELPGYVFIILLTAKDSKDDIIKGLNAGADDYLTKPFNNPELMARLRAGVRILNLEKSLREANEEIRILSITDPLTGCYNRGFLNERLTQEIRRARRYGHPLSVVLCDIDHFKSVNDTYGHQIGDLVLKEFVSTLKGSIRKDVDWVARYGGEEFFVVLPETDVDGAISLAERLRQKVESHPIEIPATGSLHITASFGVTGFGPDTPTELVSLEAIVDTADKLMYQAKKSGRNCVKGTLLGAKAQSLPRGPSLACSLMP